MLKVLNLFVDRFILIARKLYLKGLDETARSLAEAAAKEHARRGISGAVGGVLREMPSTLLFRPVIVATAATTNMLEGVKNQVCISLTSDTTY